MTTFPVRLDRLEVGLGTLVATLLPDATVVWAPSEFPRESANGLLVALRPIAGPSPRNGGAPSVQAWTLPLTLTLTITDATEGAVVFLRMSGRRFEYTVQAAETVETVRDAVLALIVDPAVSLVSASATAVSTDQIAIAADELGDLYNVDVSGPATIDVDTEQVATCQIDEVAHAVEVQIFAADRKQRSGAAHAMSRLLSAINLPSARDILNAYGLSVNAGPVVAADDRIGPVWQSRRITTMQVWQISLAAEPAGLITSVVLGFELRSGATIIEDTIEVEP